MHLIREWMHLHLASDAAAREIDKGVIQMELFYAPGACSLAPHIVSREAGLPLDLVKVDMGAKKTQTGEDYFAINGRGYVPAIRFDDGQVMTEVATLVQVLADRKPEAKLAPALGTPERYRLMEWLTFISSELHKGFAPLWYPKLPAETKTATLDKLTSRLSWLEKQIDGRSYLMGDQFTAADAYAFTILNWTGMLKVDLTPYPNIRAFMDRVAARPKVQEAMRAEGLLRDKAA
jgi:glutathione S-transferase